MERKKSITLIAIILLILLTLLFIFNFDYFKSQSSYFISMYGLAGIMIIVFIMDVIIQPFSPDVVVFGSSLISENLFSIALVAGAASVIAGTIGHLIGKKIGTPGFIHLFGDKHVKKGERLFHRWGPLAIIFGALSPVPFSAICWLSGIYRMNVWIVVLFSIITRIPRFIVFAYLGSIL